MQELLRKIQARDAVCGVIGLGYVGLPLARRFSEAGFRVLGFDVDAKKVEALAAGKSYIRHIPAEWIAQGIARKTFTPTADFARLAEADVILICVPTPLTATRDPDLSYVLSTGEAVAKTLRKRQLVVLESTTYPGTTSGDLLPILARAGLQEGQDFFLAYSPEREDPGHPEHTLGNIPKIIGGCSPAAADLAAALYAPIVPKVVRVSSCEVAEAAKVLENIYRSVNIALVNELKILFDRMGIDVWEVIEAAATKPFGFKPFYPGPGLGGHCIPIDPFYLSWKARQYETPTRFIELAGEVNAGMPHYVVERLAHALNARGKPLKGSRVLLLGIAYKENVDDLRESPALKLAELLAHGGAEVAYHDPFIPQGRSTRHGFSMDSTPLTEEALRRADAVLIVTAHSCVDYAWVVQHAPLVVDTRNATRDVKEGREKIIQA